MAYPGTQDPLFRRMLFNRGMTFAVIGVVLIVGGALYTVLSATRSKTAVSPIETSLDMAGPTNNEDEFKRRVAELNATSPGGPGPFPYGFVAIGVGAISLGVGMYQMKMSRS